MRRIFVHESLSAGMALDRDSPGHDELLAAGRAMRDAIVDDLARMGGFGLTVAVSEQEARHAVARVRAVAPQPGETEGEFVHRQSRLHDLCWVVAPETGGLLARLHAAVGEARWIGCGADAIRVASSKHATCAALSAAGIATPIAFAAGHRGAWIVKPDDGAGTIDTRRHATRAAAEADLRQRDHVAVAEPFIAGEALSVSLVVGPELAQAVAFNRQRIAVDDRGFLHDLGVQPAAVAAADRRVPRLHALAAQVAAALPGLRGYVGIDLVWNEREGPVVIEVNPRVTCAYVGLSALLARNVAGEILVAHLRSTQRDVTANATA
jgi:predicted ATP-grasp superfamily ATP-dependent carboligase